jgi:hypothetical protein
LAWAEYQETGLHVTGEAADAWLAKLEAGEEAEVATILATLHPKEAGF